MFVNSIGRLATDFFIKWQKLMREFSENQLVIENLQRQALYFFIIVNFVLPALYISESLSIHLCLLFFSRELVTNHLSAYYCKRRTNINRNAKRK